MTDSHPRSKNSSKCGVPTTHRDLASYGIKFFPTGLFSLVVGDYRVYSLSQGRSLNPVLMLLKAKSEGRPEFQF